MLLLLKNPLVIIFILLMIFCIIRGARKGILKILYGMISWILLLWFVNTACVYISDYLNVSTPLPTVIQDHIFTNLNSKYENTEAIEAGTGMDAVMKLIPEPLKLSINETIHNSIEATIHAITLELSETAIKGISIIISVIVGVLILFILDKVINLLGNLPGIYSVNMILGIVAGLVEGLLVTWFCMYLADCFPTTLFGQFIISNSKGNDLMNYVYQTNLIEQIIGI